jgi:AraC-like DNA-binding protein
LASLQLDCKHAGMSRSVFARRFLEAVGSAPVEYLLQWRMARAKDALLQGRGTMEEIAAYVGCKSASAFSTAFSHRLCCPPSDYASHLRAQATLCRAACEAREGPRHQDAAYSSTPLGNSTRPSPISICLRFRLCRFAQRRFLPWSPGYAEESPRHFLSLEIRRPLMVPGIRRSPFPVGFGRACHWADADRSPL